MNGIYPETISDTGSVFYRKHGETETYAGTKGN